MKTYTAQDIHDLIERAAVGHDKLAMDFRNTTDKVKAEALRRWAQVYIPISVPSDSKESAMQTFLEDVRDE